MKMPQENNKNASSIINIQQEDPSSCCETQPLLKRTAPSPSPIIKHDEFQNNTCDYDYHSILQLRHIPVKEEEEQDDDKNRLGRPSEEREAILADAGFAAQKRAQTQPLLQPNHLLQQQHDNCHDKAFPLYHQPLKHPSSSQPNNNISKTAKWPFSSCSQWNWTNKNALYFGLRVSILLLISSLFVTDPIHPTLDGEAKMWPQGGWVAISCLMVCWFPRLDAASVVQKAVQRTIGTLLGGSMALLFGFLALKLEPQVNRPRADLLQLFYGVGAFLVPYISMTIRLNRTSTLLSKYNYASTLALLTFTIALFPFLEQPDPWQKAVYRVINVAIGCGIATLGSVLLIPKSTAVVLQERMQHQCQLAGQGSEAILHAAAEVLSEDEGIPPAIHAAKLMDTLQHNHHVHPINDNIHHTISHSIRQSFAARVQRLSSLHQTFYRVNQDIFQDKASAHGKDKITALDVVLEKYESAIQDWKDSKSIFGLMAYDPFHWITPASQQFTDGASTILTKGLRIQTTIVVLDGIIRNDPPHFLDEQLHAILIEMGTLIRKMLSVQWASSTPHNANANNTTANCQETAKQLLMQRLYQFRSLVNTMAVDMIQTEKLMNSITTHYQHSTRPNHDGNRNHHDRSAIIVDTDSSKHYALLFLQTVEHLTTQSIGLYDTWVEVLGQQEEGEERQPADATPQRNESEIGADMV